MQFSPDDRRQDARKEPLLCGECEQLFSVWEREFGEETGTKKRGQPDLPHFQIGTDSGKKRGEETGQPDLPHFQIGTDSSGKIGLVRLSLFPRELLAVRDFWQLLP